MIYHYILCIRLIKKRNENSTTVTIIEATLPTAAKPHERQSIKVIDGTVF